MKNLIFAFGTLCAAQDTFGEWFRGIADDINEAVGDLGLNDQIEEMAGEPVDSIIASTVRDSLEYVAESLDSVDE